MDRLRITYREAPVRPATRPHNMEADLTKACVLAVGTGLVSKDEARRMLGFVQENACSYCGRTEEAELALIRLAQVDHEARGLRAELRCLRGERTAAQLATWTLRKQVRRTAAFAWVAWFLVGALGALVWLQGAL